MFSLQGKDAIVRRQYLSFFLSFFRSFVPQPALRQVRSLFQTEFSTHWDLQFPFLKVIEQLLSLLPRLPVTCVCPTLPCFRRQAVPAPDVASTVSLLLFTVRRIFLSSLSLCNTYSFFHTIDPTDPIRPSAAHFTRLIQQILSAPLQHISHD